MYYSLQREIRADSHLVRVVKPLRVALNWSQLLVPEHKQRGRHETAGRRDGTVSDLFRTRAK